MTIDGITNPEVLEAMACTEAQSLVADLQLSNIQVSSDCLTVIKEIIAGVERGKHSMIIKEVLSRRSCSKRLISCMRSENQMARPIGLLEQLLL
jgi:ribonuclease HI